VLVVITSIAIVASPAVAEPASDGPDSAEAVATYRLEIEQGTAAFHDGRYADARASFQRAHAIHPEPGLVFNIASCWRRAGDAAAALDAYRRFLAVAPAADSRVRLAAQTVEALEAELARQAARPPAPPSLDDDIDVVVSDGGDGARDATGLIFEPSPPVATAPPAPSRSRRSILRGLGMGGTAIGGALLIGAAVEGLRARSIESDLEGLSGGHTWGRGDADRYREGSAAATGARVLAISGVAVAAAGVTCFVLGRQRDERAPVIEPSIGGGGAQVTVRGRF
jgi:hypothetical protein